MKIYLFRHGETDYNKNKRMQGSADIPLNEYGRELAKVSGEALKDVVFDRVFCSPLGRAQETARLILGEKQVDIEIDQRLREIDAGPLEGTYFADARADENHPFHNFILRPEKYIPLPGGDSFEEVIQRGKEFFDEVILPLEGHCETILIVAHGAFNRGQLNRLLGISLEEYWKISLPNCAASILEVKDGELKVVTESTIYYETPANSRP
jgi:probable phosphoglycerate mutase